MMTTISDYTITSILSVAVGYVIEVLISNDVPLACNLLSQMVTVTLCIAVVKLLW